MNKIAFSCKHEIRASLKADNLFMQFRAYSYNWIESRTKRWKKKMQNVSFFIVSLGFVEMMLSSDITIILCLKNVDLILS